MRSRNKDSWGFIAAIVVIFALLAFSATVSAGVINVPSAGNETIQQAINNASAGDTILVNATDYAGTKETVVVNKSNIIIRSVNGRAVIDANGTDDHVVNITNQTNVTLEGFKIMNATGTTQDVAGIYMDNATECTISNTIVTHISATENNSYGIYLYDSSDNTFSSNTTVSNITATVTVKTKINAYGIALEYSNNTSFSSNINVSNVNVSNDNKSSFALGIALAYSNNTRFNSSITISDLNIIGHEARGAGISLGYSNNTRFNSSITISYFNANATSGAGAIFGIVVEYSHHNSFLSSIAISDFNVIHGGASGIYLSSSSNNRFSSSINVSNVNSTYDSASGISLLGSSNNRFSSSISVSNNSAFTAFGIVLSESNNTSFSSSISVSNVNSTGDYAYGIYLYDSSNNSFSSGSISDINGPFWWAFYCFYSDESSHGNSAEKITMSSFPTTISFTYDNGVGIKSVETPPPDPAGKVNIGKYVNATNVKPNSWLFLNVSYDESDISLVQEDSLKLWKYNGTWHEVAGVNGVNTAENYIYANITDFSVFAPLGNPVTSITIPTATGTGNVTINTSSGYFCSETNALPTSPHDPPALTFPHGFFNFTICGLNDTTNPETVTINFTFPSPIPTDAEFWKYNATDGTWYWYPFGSNDGDNVISITITDNGPGDHNPALGIIEDPNGVGWRIPVPAVTPIGLVALVSVLSGIAATTISTRRKRR